MTPAQIVSLGIGLALCVPAIGTQVVAQTLHYPAWLGAPLFKLGRLWLYAPYQYFVWWWQYAWYYPVPFEWGLVWMAVWMLGGAVLVAWLLKRSGWSRQPLHTDHGWATARDIRKAKLFVHVKK